MMEDTETSSALILSYLLKYFDMASSTSFIDKGA